MTVDYRLTLLNSDQRIRMMAPDTLRTIGQPYARITDGIDVARLADAAGTTSATLRRVVYGLRPGSYVLFGVGTVSAELRQIATVSNRTITWSLALANSHAANSDALILERAVTIPQWFGAVGDGVANDGSALRAWGEQHRLLRTQHGIDGLMCAPDGVYIFDLAPHPANNNIPVGFYSHRLHGSSRQSTVFKLADNQAFFGTKSPYLIGNYEVGSDTTEMVQFRDFTLNGNAANQNGLGWSEMAGLKFSRTRRGWAQTVLVKNIFSTGHSPDSEGFAIKWSIGADGGAIDCITDNDDSSGNESSGFSMSTCINMTLVNCTATNSPLGNCFTANKCYQLAYTNCLAQMSGDTTDRTGFNLERSHYVTWTNCTVGGYAHDTTNVTPYTAAQDLGCKAGWVINAACNDVSLVGCYSISNDIGLIFKGQSLRTRLTNCVFVDNGKGVSIDTTDGTLVSEIYIAPDCAFNGSITADIGITGGYGNTTWRGYNTPSLGASAAVNDNPFPADVTVGLTGGAISEVSIKSAPGNNYRPVGSGPGHYALPHGAKFKVTYTVAPTMFMLVGK